MDQNQEHLKNLTEIRSLMERFSSFMSLSGLARISAGIIGIITFIVSYCILMPYNNENNVLVIPDALKMETFIYMVIISASSVCLTFASVIYFTARKSKKKGLPIWDNSAKRLLVNLFIPLIAGGILCLILGYHAQYRLIPGVMLIFYGLALLNASKFTLHDIRYLGICELIIGLLASYMIGLGLWFWLAGFGIMNIVYGIFMYIKYDR